jgi:hypothetical protein
MTDLWTPPRPASVFLSEDERQYQAEDDASFGEFAFLAPWEAREFAAELCINEELRSLWPVLPTKTQLRWRRKARNEPPKLQAMTYRNAANDLFAVDFIRQNRHNLVSCWTILHEFAHHTLPFPDEFRDHGPEFATNLLVMAGIVFGGDAFDRLGLEYRKYGIPIQPSVTSVTLTD